MSFSAFNVGSQMVTLTGNKLPQLRLATKPVAGGSFTPSALEAAFIMRSSLDYQFENAFLTKYKALMQNRLNFLQEKMKDAYTNVLNTSMAQQVGQNAAIETRADVRLDGFDSSAAAKLIKGVLGANGFEDIGIAPEGDLRLEDAAANAAAIAQGLVSIWRTPGKLSDGMTINGALPEDAIAGWARSLGGALTPVQFRSLLEYATGAGNVQGDIQITMRAEDDPPVPEPVNIIMSILATITTAVTGPPPAPTYFNQKVEEHETQYKTGGFWSAINYLYNFAPREIKYSYAVGYTVNSDEAGNDAYLSSGLLVDARENVVGPTDAFLQKDQRVKWASFEPTEGYQHEISGTSSRFPNVVNRANAWLSGNSQGGGANQYGADVWYDESSFSTANAGALTQVVDGVLFQSGTYKYTNGVMVNSNNAIPAVAGAGGKLIETAGTNGVLYANSNIQDGSIFKNTVEWNGGLNDGLNTDDEPTSRGRINSSLFFNHYEVETRTVDFNNSTRSDSTSLPGAPDNTGQLLVVGGLERSNSVDASKDYQRLKDTGEISRGAGNVSRTFNGEFVQGLHKIESVNGQDLAGNEQKQASPILGNFEIGKYEGILRSYHMSRNIVDYTPPTKMEINAADTVPTDWYQGEMLVSSATANLAADLAQGKMWFPWLADTIYSGSAGGYGKLGSVDQVVQARNTFELKKQDFLLPSGFTQDVTGYYQPTYTKQDYFINVNLTGVHHDSLTAANYFDSTDDTAQVPTRRDFGINLEDAKIFVNGELLKPPSEQPIGTPIPGQPNPQMTVTALTENGAGSRNYNVGLRMNIKDYLREGMNTIVVQTRDATFNLAVGDNGNESIAVTGDAANTAAVNTVINNKIITGYNTVGEAVYNPEFDRQNLLKVQSRWQARAVPHTLNPNLTIDPISDFVGVGGVLIGDNRATMTAKINALAVTDTNYELYSRMGSHASSPEKTGSAYKVTNSFVDQILQFINQQKYRDIFRMGMLSNLNKMAIQGSANLPSGSSLQGNISLYYDQQKQMIVVNQDKLVGKS